MVQYSLFIHLVDVVVLQSLVGVFYDPPANPSIISRSEGLAHHAQEVLMVNVSLTIQIIPAMEGMDPINLSQAIQKMLLCICYSQ